MQATLGRPNREQIVTSRPPLLTTLEAIQLANGPEFAKLLEQGAAKLLAEHAADPQNLVSHVYLASLAREPSEQERAIASEILGATPDTAAVADLLWMVFMLPEFQLVR